MASFRSIKYQLLVEVGTGSFGTVYKAREVGEGQRFLAVKKFKIPENCSDNGVPVSIIREVALLRRMQLFNHPNIVKLLDATVDQEGHTVDLTLVLEYIDQDLAAFLSKALPSGLDLNCIKDVMSQLLQGLDFLHMNLVMHRDLKPPNILVSSHGVVKIADFGLARVYSHNIALTPGMVTLWYRAPEVLLNSAYMFSVDMWSAGCIFAELFLLKPIFQGYTEAQQLHKIFEVTGLPREEDWPGDSPFPYSESWGPSLSSTMMLDNVDEDVNDLLAKCLTFKPSKRLSATEALAHPFFTKDTVE